MFTIDSAIKPFYDTANAYNSTLIEHPVDLDGHYLSDIPFQDRIHRHIHEYLATPYVGMQFALAF